MSVPTGTIVAGTRSGHEDVLVCIGDSICADSAYNIPYSGAQPARMYYPDTGPGWKSLTAATRSAGNSFWASVITELAALQAARSFAIVNTGVSSTRVYGAAATWPKGQAQYTAMAAILAAAGVTAPKAFLVHLGSNDQAVAGITLSGFQAAAEQLISDLLTDYPGAMVVWAQMGAGGSSRAAADAVRQGIANLWGATSVYQGPVLFDLFPGDGVHFTTQQNGLDVGKRWALALNEHFYGGAVRSGTGPSVVSASINPAKTVVTVTLSSSVYNPYGKLWGFQVMDGDGTVMVNNYHTASGAVVTVGLKGACSGTPTLACGSGSDCAVSQYPNVEWSGDPWSIVRDTSDNHLPVPAFSGMAITQE